MSKENNHPVIKTFFDPVTNTAQHVVFDPATKQAVIIDPVLDFDPASGKTGTGSADAILQYGQQSGLQFKWILETHAHADHLSAAHYLAKITAAKTAIGCGITHVQKHFAPVFNFEESFVSNGSQFDRLLADGDVLALGSLDIQVLATPGHTPACVTYHIVNALFVGDTLFMPDYGSARADFPGGDAGKLFHSIQRLYEFPDETRVFLCHDYKAPGRDEFVYETSVGEEKRRNVHIQADTTYDEFVKIRTKRDATLSMPKLILPSLQVNLRGGRLPPASKNGISYLKLPLNQF